MLTRLKVSGFKNLVDVDVRFGPFTCIAGANGTGKSNLLDAIQFLSALADGKTLRDAAQSVRSISEHFDDGHNLFHRVGDVYDKEISFEVEIIVPSQGRDDLNLDIQADHTMLRYSLTLTFNMGAFSAGFGDGLNVDGLKIVREELLPIKSALGFSISDVWHEEVVYGNRTEPLITTQTENGEDVVVMQNRRVPTRRLQKTLLSSAGSGDDVIAIFARQEMQSWRLLHLEPSAMRKPDPLATSFKLGTKGSHIPATLYTLSGRYSSLTDWNREHTYSRVAGRLSELIDDVQEIRLDVNEERELITLYVKDFSGTDHPAKALSDGTLRFLALAVIEANPFEKGVIFLEEPENGISPNRIPALLRLLQDIATDTEFPVGDDNPLRQVIITTHSPVVVQQVPDDSLLIAGLKNAVRDGQRFKHATFSYLPDTWRAKQDASGIVAKGNLLSYLNPVIREREQNNGFTERRVIDRPDLQPYIPGVINSDE